MLEIVLQSRSYDLSNIYAITLNSRVLSCIVTGNGKLASEWKSGSKLANKLMGRAVKDLEEVKANTSN